jgi:hypothetical protein
VWRGARRSCCPGTALVSARRLPSQCATTQTASTSPASMQDVRQASRSLHFKSRNFAAKSQASRRAAVLSRQRESRGDARAALRSDEGWTGRGETLESQSCEQEELGADALNVNVDAVETDAPVYQTADVADAYVDTRGGLAEEDECESANAPPFALSPPVRGRQGRASRRQAQPAMSTPEWLVDVPARLGDEWYVLPRPDGKRVFVVASGGRTVVRARDGQVVKSAGFYFSMLPGGSKGPGCAKGVTILDCVLPAGEVRPVIDRLWVLDVMIWNDANMYECPAAFRFFWLRNSLAELDDRPKGTGASSNGHGGGCGANSNGWRGPEDDDEPVGMADVNDENDAACDDDDMSIVREVDEVDLLSVAQASSLAGHKRPPRRRRRGGGVGDRVFAPKRRGSDPCVRNQQTSWLLLQPVPMYDADSAGVSAAADTALSAAAGIGRQDGLLFYLKEAHYELGLTPVILSWKDISTSRHAIETFPEPPPADVPRADLPLIATLAHYPSLSDSTLTVLETGDNPPTTIADIPTSALECLGRALPSRLVRVQVINTGAVARGEGPEVVPVGLAGPGRTAPDSWSRIMYQCKARHCPVTIRDLMGARPTAVKSDGDGVVGASAAATSG